jgi:hypothetical protein
VGVEAHGLAGGQQGREARVLGHLEAPAQGVARQAVNGQGHQGVAVQAQQGHRVAGKERAQGVQQAAVALALGDVLRQVGHQGHEGAQPFGCGQFHLMMRRIDSN